MTKVSINFQSWLLGILIFPPKSLLMNLNLVTLKRELLSSYHFKLYRVWKYMFSLTSIIAIYFFTPSRGSGHYWLSVSKNSEYGWKLGYLHRILSITTTNDGHWRGHDNWLIIVFPPTKTWSKIKIIGPDLRVSFRLP